jgi:hypothetical protein
VQAKRDGFADRYLAQILGVDEAAVRRRRLDLGLVESWEAVPVSGVENAAYYFSSYNAPDSVAVSARRKIMVLGGGPNRIGQGIEFDYCCVHTAFALREAGFETIMVNCNPETVSTDYDTSDKLYFEPLTVEDVLSIYAKESPEGVLVQFGGQTPLNIARQLEAAGVTIIGTSPATIDLAEDREQFNAMMASSASPAGIGDGQHPGRSAGDCRAHRLSADRPPLLRARRPGHGSGARRGDAARIPGQGGGRHPGAPHPHRSLPAACHRGRGRCHLRRPDRVRPGGDGAYRAGGGPFR